MKLIYIAIGLLMTLSVNAGQIEITSQSPVQLEGRHSLNFGTVWVNSRVVQYFNLRNTGTTPLNYRGAYIYGGDFSADQSCVRGLLPNETCSFSIAYWPMFEGMSSGRFVLSFIEDDVDFDLWGQARR